MLQHWASDGKLYRGSFVLLKFIELVTHMCKRKGLNAFQQYKTAYICRTHLRSPNAVAFLVMIIKIIVIIKIMIIILIE